MEHWASSVLTLSQSSPASSLFWQPLFKVPVNSLYLFSVLYEGHPPFFNIPRFNFSFPTSYSMHTACRCSLFYCLQSNASAIVTPYEDLPFCCNATDYIPAVFYAMFSLLAPFVSTVHHFIVWLGVYSTVIFGTFYATSCCSTS